MEPFDALDRGVLWLAAVYGEVGVTPSDACIALVKRFEGCRLKAYPDPGTGAAPWTIGYGATGAGISPGVVWTQAQADHRLAEDLAQFGDGVAKMVGKAKTSQHEFDALVSFSFNVGLGNLRTSTLLRLHMAGDKDGAANQFQKWTRAAGRILPGLITRRSAEATLYRTP